VKVPCTVTHWSHDRQGVESPPNRPVRNAHIHGTQRVQLLLRFRPVTPVPSGWHDMPGRAVLEPRRPVRGVLGKYLQFSGWHTSATTRLGWPWIFVRRRRLSCATATLWPLRQHHLDLSIPCTDTDRLRDDAESWPYWPKCIQGWLPKVSPHAVRAGLPGRNRKTAALSQLAVSLRSHESKRHRTRWPVKNIPTTRISTPYHPPGIPHIGRPLQVGGSTRAETRG